MREMFVAKIGKFQGGMAKLVWPCASIRDNSCSNKFEHATLCKMYFLITATYLSRTPTLILTPIQPSNVVRPVMSAQAFMVASALIS